MLESFSDDVLIYVDIHEDEALLTFKSGRVLRLHHVQDCCESVFIQSIEGDWMGLIGGALSIDNEIEGGEQEYGTFTVTTFTFTANEDTVVMKWHGESNGYYSEGVNIDVMEAVTPDGLAGLIPEGFPVPKTRDEWSVLADYHAESGAIHFENFSRRRASK